MKIETDYGTKFVPGTNFVKQLKRKSRPSYPADEDYHNEPLILNDMFALSIQAGTGCYCSPKQNSSCNSIYELFEVALLQKSGDDWLLTQPRKYFGNFYWASSFEDGDSPVAGYVSIDYIEDMIIDIQKYSHLINFI